MVDLHHYFYLSLHCKEWKFIIFDFVFSTVARLAPEVTQRRVGTMERGVPGTQIQISGNIFLNMFPFITKKLYTKNSPMMLNSFMIQL